MTASGLGWWLVPHSLSPEVSGGQGTDRAQGLPPHWTCKETSGFPPSGASRQALQRPGCWLEAAPAWGQLGLGQRPEDRELLPRLTAGVCGRLTVSRGFLVSTQMQVHTRISGASEHSRAPLGP